MKEGGQVATIVYLIASLLSLFFSFIFATPLNQRKEWSHSFIGFSLFFYFLASFSLCVGHLFSWYPWTKGLFTLTYSFVFPLLLGGAIYRVVHKLKQELAWQVALGYASILFMLVLSIMTQPEPLVSWLMKAAGFLFILFSLWLWLKEGEAWLWFAISGSIGLALQLLSTREWLGATGYSFFWLAILICLWRALSIGFPLDLAYARNREERPQRGEVLWKEV